MKNNNNFYFQKMMDNMALHERMIQFVKDWESAETAPMRDYILEDAIIDFSIFDAEISRDEFIQKLAVRTAETTCVRFDPHNYVCFFEKGKAQMTLELVMEFVNTKEESAEFFGQGNFVASLVRVGKYDWKFSELRFNLQEDDLIVHPVLTTKGIEKIKNSGDRKFVENWYMHDDRIGCFVNKRRPSIIPELDMPWYAIKNPEYLGSDEEQIERTIFAYYYSVDQILGTQFVDYVFNEDAMIIYDDGTPLNLREEIDAMRTQIQGSPRVCHIAKVIEIKVDGNHAVAKTYNRIPGGPEDKDPEKRTWRYAWARYRFTLTKRNGVWKIDRLNYYPSFFVAEK